MRAGTTSSASGACAPTPTAQLLFCENETNTSGCSARPTRRPTQGRHQRLRRQRRGRGEPRRAGTKCAAHQCSRCPPGGIAEIRVRLTARRRRGADFGAASTACSRCAAPRPTSSTPTVIPAGARRRRGAASCARRWPGCCGPSSTTTTTSTSGCASTASTLGTPNAPDRAQRAVVPHGQRRRHLDARQVGVPLVRGLGPGVPLRRRWRWSTSTSPRTSSSSCCATRYLHPNGQIPAYEWNFGDVNPPVHGVGGAVRLPSARPRSAARATATSSRASSSAC